MALSLRGNESSHLDHLLHNEKSESDEQTVHHDHVTASASVKAAWPECPQCSCVSQKGLRPQAQEGWASFN